MSIAESVTSLVKDYGYPHLEVTSQGMEVANLSTTVENDDWVLIVDAVILVSIWRRILNMLKAHSL